MKSGKVVQEMFFELIEKKNISVFDVYFHPDVKFHIFDGMLLDYFEFKKLCEKVFDIPLQITIEFSEESIVKTVSQFAAQLVVKYDHKSEGIFEYSAFIIVKLKEGKIWDYRFNAERNWIEPAYMAETVADVLNDFSIDNECLCLIG